MIVVIIFVVTGLAVAIALWRVKGDLVTLTIMGLLSVMRHGTHSIPLFLAKRL